MLIVQFIYCSCQHDGPFDTGTGWKIADVLAVPERTAESDALVRQAASRAGLYKPIQAPQFAAREVIEALPSSLRLDPVAAGMACLLRSSSAGQDYSRRTASFSHGLLVSVQARMGSRPAELWDWDWLQPIDADEIESARLKPAVEPAPNALTPQSILPFALGRPEVIRPLVAGFAQCLETNSTLILIEQDPPVAACWFAALQYLVSPAAAWSIPFDTYQTTDALLHRPEQGARMIAVTEIDDESVAQLVRSGQILVSTERPASEAAETALAWSDGLHGELQASPWAEFALRLFDAGDQVVASVVAVIDELDGELSSGGSSSPLWLLPVAVLCGDFPLNDADRDLAARLCISLWPVAEQVSASLVERLRILTVQSLSNPREVFYDRAKELSASAKIADSFTDLVLGGYLTGLLGASAGIPDEVWLPPMQLLSEPALIELVAAVPDLLGWIEPMPLTEPAVAVALLVAACLVAETPSSEQRTATQGWLEPQLASLLGALVAEDQPASQRLYQALPPLPDFVWANVLDPMLSEMLADPRPPAPVQTDPRGSRIDAESGEIFLSKSGSYGWRRTEPLPPPVDRPKPAPAPEPGKRWPAAFHEWIGAAGLDEKLTSESALNNMTPLLAEHAAFRSRHRMEGLNSTTVAGLAFWAQARTMRPGRHTKESVLRAAQVFWPDLHEMLPVAARLLNQLEPTVDTRLLLDQLLIMVPLGSAGALLRTPGAMVAGQLALVDFHLSQANRPAVTRALNAHTADRYIGEYNTWLLELEMRDRARSRLLRASLWVKMAATFLCLDLTTAIPIWQGPAPSKLAIGRRANKECDFDGAWDLILEQLKNPAGNGPTDLELGELLAYLHLRSVMRLLSLDPAAGWLAGTDTTSELPMTARLRLALDTANDEVVRSFREQVAQGTKLICGYSRLMSLLVTDVKEFQKIRKAATDRLDAGGGSRFRHRS